jgi:nucleotide-binding universal stress UspA family protein
MNNILIPTDFSENSLNAIKYAISFFKEREVNFYVLHVSLVNEMNEEECYYKGSDVLLDQKTAINPSDRLQLELQNIKNLTTNKKHNFHSILEYVQFIEAIRKCVVENNIDYIVMGTKGASKYSNTVLGSHTADVITRVKCNVMVIPEKARYSKPENIVFPTDFNIYYKNKLLNSLSEIIESNCAKLSVLYISKKKRDLTPLQKKNRNFLEDYLEDKPHSFYFISNANINNAIEDFVEKKSVDMIAMVAKNLNLFQRTLFQPTIAKISYHTKVPFLVLHE